LRSIILDSGAFIAAERFDSRVFNVLDVAGGDGNPILIDAPVIAEAWKTPPRTNAAKLVKTGDVVALTESRARAVGALLAGTATNQLADAGAALLARDNRPATVLTSDPNDIASLLRTLRCSVSVGAPKPGVDVTIEPL